MQAATVYLVTNVLNGHTYVGVTRFTPEYRWAQHVSRAKGSYRTYLSKAINKYGAVNFIVEAFASCLSREHSGYVERLVIQRLAPVYNQTNGGEVTIGRKWTPEVRARMSALMSQRRLTPEQCSAMSLRKKEEYRKNPRFRAAAVEALGRGRQRVNQENRIAAIRRADRPPGWNAASHTPEAEAKRMATFMARPEHDRQMVFARSRLARIKPVVCHTLDVTFGCCEEAAGQLGISTSSIYKVCAGARSSVNGLTFSYGAR